MAIDPATLPVSRGRMGPRRPGHPLPPRPSHGLLQSLPPRQTPPRKVPARLVISRDGRDRVAAYGASRSGGLKPPLLKARRRGPANKEGRFTNRPDGGL